MKNQIIIRKAVQRDIPVMVGLWKEMMDLHKERDKFFTLKAGADKKWFKFITGHISSKKSTVLVAEHNGRLVGHCLTFISEYPSVLTTKRYGVFQELAVTGDYRRNGIGQRLVEEMLKWFRKRRIKRLEVRVSVFNEISTAFWRKMGFKPYLETLCLEI
jgi:GNAT superfamily N-acetyltransferase